MSIGGCEKASTFADLDAEDEAVASRDAKVDGIRRLGGHRRPRVRPNTTWGQRARRATWAFPTPPSCLMSRAWVGRSFRCRQRVLTSGRSAWF